MNECEHCHETAPDDCRFCSRACAECERTEHDETRGDCAGLCLQAEATASDRDARADRQALCYLRPARRSRS